MCWVKLANLIIQTGVDYLIFAMDKKSGKQNPSVWRKSILAQSTGNFSLATTKLNFRNLKPRSPNIVFFGKCRYKTLSFQR